MPHLYLVLEEHASFVRALASGLIRDAQSADDVVQETWLAVLLSKRQIADPRPWLSRVVSRIAASSRRNVAFRAAREMEAARAECDPDSADAIAQREVLQRLTNAVLALEEPYRTTLLKRYYDDLSPREIADRSGVPLATVRSRLQRALDRLRLRLDRESGGDRAAWMRGLVPVLGSGKLGSLGSAGGLAACSGVLAMGTAAKVAAGLAVTACVGALGWWGMREIEPASRSANTGQAELPLAESAPVWSQAENPGDTESQERLALPVQDIEVRPAEPEADTPPGTRFDFLPYPNGGEGEFEPKYAAFDLEHLAVAIRILGQKLDRDLRAIADEQFEMGDYQSDHGDDALLASLTFSEEPKPGLGRTRPVSRERKDRGRWVTEWTLVTEVAHPEIWAETDELTYVMRRVRMLTKASK
jgi:RNA polymerase sigma-70 factor (ECF subfamily)